jgi:hypothetical protein
LRGPAVAGVLLLQEPYFPGLPGPCIHGCSNIQRLGEVCLDYVLNLASTTPLLPGLPVSYILYEVRLGYVAFWPPNSSGLPGLCIHIKYTKVR